MVGTPRCPVPARKTGGMIRARRAFCVDIPLPETATGTPPHGIPAIPMRRWPKGVLLSLAFTLLELLVVISIIGILAAMLFPAMVVAKKRAYRVSDLNNLKQFGIATHLVTTDNNDLMPSANWLSLDQVTNPPQGWLYTYNSAATGPAQFSVQSGSFFAILLNPKMYFCPSDDTNSAYFQLRPQQSSSYVINGAICGFGKSPTMVKDTSLLPTAIAFWECNNSTSNDNITLFNDGASYPDENTSGRHGKVTPVGMVDGSAQLMNVNEWTEKMNETNANELWCYPDSADGR